MYPPILAEVFTALLVLAQLTSARILGWEDPTGNSIFDPYKHKSPPQTPVEAWERDKEAHPDYFELTQRNLNDSGVVPWYPEWVERMRANYPENYTNLGEIRFFSKYAWGDSNFMCGITQGGCSTVPTAKGIIERLLLYRKGEDHTLAANLAEARRIFFMAKEIQAITELFVYQWHIFDKVQQNAMDMIDNLVAEFTQQVEIESDQICSIIILSYTTLLEIGKTVMNTFGNIPEKAMSIAMMTDALAELAINTGLESGASPTSGGENFGPPEDQTNWTMERKQKSAKAQANKKKIMQMLAPAQKLAVIGATKGIEATHSADAAAEYQRGREDQPWLGMAGKSATGFCSGLGGGFSNENAQRSAKLKQYVLKAFPQIQGAIWENLDRAVNWTGNGTSSFGSWVGKHDWSIHGQKRNYQHDEERATQLYLDSLMSIAWRSAKCYQKCLCDPTIKLNKYHNHKERTTKYRYFPEDGENCVCQPQCWSASRRNPYEKRLFGIDSLRKYDHNLTDISSMSYNYYRANGNEYKPPDMDIRHEPIDADAGISLAHCVSSQIQIGDFDDETTNYQLNLNRRNNRRFPCTCGNWQSNETESFMDIFAMGNGQAWMKSHAGDELFKQICPENLKGLPPLNQYLAYCRLGIRWPRNGETLEVRHDQTDKHCGDIINLYSSWVDNEREANKHFCTDNKIAKEIFKSQKDVHSVLTYSAHRAKSVEHVCHGWLRNQGGKGKNIAVPADLIMDSDNRTAILKNGGFGNGTNSEESVVQIDNGLYEDDDGDGEDDEPSAIEESTPTTFLTEAAP